MISALARFYSNCLLHEGIISEEDREIHEYGLTAFLIFVCNYGALLLLAVLTDRLTETIIFLLAYSIPRNIIGGWHAGTPLLCSFCGIVMWGTVMMLYHGLKIHKSLLIVLLLVSTGTLLYLIHKKDISDKRKELGQASLMLLFAATVVLLLIDCGYGSLILYATVCNIIMNLGLGHL